MNFFYPIYPQTSYYAAGRGTGTPAVELLNKGTLSSHHYLVVCLASVPYFVCNVFFGEKDALAGRLFITN